RNTPGTLRQLQYRSAENALPGRAWSPLRTPDADYCRHPLQFLHAGELLARVSADPRIRGRPAALSDQPVSAPDPQLPPLQLATPLSVRCLSRGMQVLYPRPRP